MQDMGNPFNRIHGALPESYPPMKHVQKLLSTAVVLTMAQAANAQLLQGPSTGSTPYLLPVQPGTEIISMLTVDNTGANADDTVPNLVGGAAYGMAGIPDGLGAYDNGDGTFTLLMNHEIGNTLGAVRAHGAKGAYVSKWIVNKSNLAITGGTDLMTSVYDWNTGTQSVGLPITFAFSRFCSADLPEVSAFYNATSGFGSQERIFMHGEEGGSNGYQLGTVATGSDAGKSYILGKFNLSTNGSDLTGVGAWENALACPVAQDTTIVIGNNDGGGGIMNNAVSVYIGTKQSTGTEVDKAGLTNGTLGFVRVGSITAEINNTATRTTGIANGSAFTISANSSTTFSRPEDGAWNPLNPSQYYFVTTDRLDNTELAGSQIGLTRLWRLTFSNIANPAAGGTIDLLIDGQVVSGQKVNMFDNMTVNKTTGNVILQEDVGGAAHNGKMWELNIASFTGATNSGTLTMIAKHDSTRFGDVVSGVAVPATAPFNNDEETSGVIDITSIMAGSALHKGNPGEAWYLSVDQAHYNSTTSGSTITTTQVEGGQLFAIHQVAPTNNLSVTRSGIARDRRTGLYSQQLTVKNNNAGAVGGPFFLALDSPVNVNLSNASGVTANYPSLGNSYINVPGSSLAPGASSTVTLQFVNPANSGIIYTPRTLNGMTNNP